MKNREINQVDQHGGSFVNSNLHLQGWEDLRTGNTVSGCHFLHEFSAEKTEINHGVENLAKYVITCGNWGHKWRRWKYLSLIVIISDRALDCYYFLAYNIFMWVSIYSVLSGIVGLFERKKPPLSFSMIPTPFKAYRLPHCAPNTYKCTDRFHTQSSEKRINPFRPVEHRKEKKHSCCCGSKTTNLISNCPHHPLHYNQKGEIRGCGREEGAGHQLKSLQYSLLASECSELWFALYGIQSHCTG